MTMYEERTFIIPVRSLVVMCRTGVSKCGARFETLLQGPTQWCVEFFEGVHGVMIEIVDVTKARAVRTTPRPFQQIHQWTAQLNQKNQENSNPH